MPKKRKRECSEERFKKKIRKYEEKLKKIRQRSPSPASSTPAPSTPTHTENDPIIVTIDDNLENYENNKEGEEETLGEEILNLLGDAPQEQNYGPAIHKELSVRWASIIKNGIQKEKRTELKKKYLPPQNCKIIDAPKLNLEARAAVADTTIKRDKALVNKQNQIGCALTALARAFETLVNHKDVLLAINHISDSARLLCDYQYQESLTRKNFILQSIDQDTRDTIKDTEVDEWLFGENFAEKIKASKAIRRSGQDISLNKNKKPLLPSQKSLNHKGPVRYPTRNQLYRTGPPQSYQNYKKRPQASVTQKTQVSTKFPQRSTNQRN